MHCSQQQSSIVARFFQDRNEWIDMDSYNNGKINLAYVLRDGVNGDLRERVTVSSEEFQYEIKFDRKNDKHEQKNKTTGRTRPVRRVAGMSMWREFVRHEFENGDVARIFSWRNCGE